MVRPIIVNSSDKMSLNYLEIHSNPFPNSVREETHHAHGLVVLGSSSDKQWFPVSSIVVQVMIFISGIMPM